MIELGLLGAFLGGVLTLLSPCSVMLLPAFFSYAFSNPRELLAKTGIFYLGLITTLVPLGVLAGTVGAFVSENRVLFIQVAASVVIVLGLLMLANVPLPLIAPRSASEGAGSASVYALGTVYGLAGVCAGPLLGAVLTLAALGGNALYGGVVLLVFAAGMVLPLFALALVWGKLPFVRDWMRPREVKIGRWRNTWTGIISGVLMVGVGVLLIVTNGTASLGSALGATDQVRLESWVMTATSTVPDIIVVGVTVAFIVAAVAIRMLRQRATASIKPVDR
ncbi:cytochrome c biogenesis CcdA family protein (plasmid) [Coraliomargarita sp. W4R53]